MFDGFQIIYVEDDASVRNSLTQTLELAGFTVQACATAEAALPYLTPDLRGIVVSDVQLPKMSGLDLLQRVRQLDPELPVILVTAPAIALMWSLGDHGTAMNIVYTILLIVAGMADNVLKPLMLGRGVDAPMPVVLLGALGGMAASGILGMFIGATLLSIGYRIFMSWVNDGQVGDSQTPVVPDDKDAQ